MKIKVAIYARVSKADQDPDAQLFALRDYAAQRGFAVYKEYVDYVSGNIEKRGARSTPKDQAFQDLMAVSTAPCVGARLLDGVIGDLLFALGVPLLYDEATERAEQELSYGRWKLIP